MTKYYKNKKENSFVVTNSQLKLNKKEWEEITVEQYEEETGNQEQGTSEE